MRDKPDPADVAVDEIDRVDKQSLLSLSRARRIEIIRGAYAAETKELERLRTAFAEQNHEIEQILGEALGYPTDADGVIVGDHVAMSLVDEVVKELATARAKVVAVNDEMLRPIVVSRKAIRRNHE